MDERGKDRRGEISEEPIAAIGNNDGESVNLGSGDREKWSDFGYVLGLSKHNFLMERIWGERGVKMTPRFLAELPGVMGFPSTEMGKSVSGAGFGGMKGKSAFEMLLGIQVELLQNRPRGGGE